MQWVFISVRTCYTFQPFVLELLLMSRSLADCLLLRAGGFIYRSSPSDPALLQVALSKCLSVHRPLPSSQKVTNLDDLTGQVGKTSVLSTAPPVTPSPDGDGPLVGYSCSG